MNIHIIGMPQKRLSVFAFALSMSSITIMAQDNLLDLKANYETVNQTENISRGSWNPAFIKQLKFKTLTDVKLGYEHESGDFCRVDEGVAKNGLDFSLYGIKKYGKLTFEGLFNYNNTYTDNQSWRSTLFISDDNPFVIGDLVRGSFTKEVFHLNGGLAYEFSHMWAGGLRADFKSGSNADETDPRPLISAIRFNFNPGLTYHKEKNTLGLSLQFERLSESLEYSVIRTTESYNVYLMQGLASPIVMNAQSYRRRYFGTNLGGHVQWQTTFGEKKNFLELGYIRKFEEAKDYEIENAFHGGEYHNHHISLSDRVMWKCADDVHQLHLNLNVNLIEGFLFDQKQVYDENYNVAWVVDRKYTGYNDNKMDVSLSYRIDRFKEENPHYALEGIIGGCLDGVKDNPDKYKENYATVFAQALGTCHFRINQYRCQAQFGMKYNCRLSKTIQLPYDGEVSPYKIIANNYIVPLFEYQSADYLQGNARLNVYLPVRTKWGFTNIGLFAQYQYRHYMGNYTTLSDTYTETYGHYAAIGKNRHFVSAGLSILF